MSVKTKALSEKLVHVARAQPVCVPEETPLREALAVMRYRQVPCLLVTKGGKLTGIFTERDFLMKVAGKPSGGSVGEQMTRKPVIATLDETVGEAVEEMNAKGLRNLPLADKSGAPASVVTVSSLIRYLADHFPAEVVNLPPHPQRAAETDGA
jgi:CBS domain-containing protein